jgi:predicted transcriptional regulator
MAVRDTSREAYAVSKPEFGRQQQEIMNYVRHSTATYTRSELALALDLAINAVCGRVNELIKLGALVELDRRKCKVTGRSAYALRAASVCKATRAPEQRALL